VAFGMRVGVLTEWRMTCSGRPRQ